ncbi:mitosis inhibitor protein kinase swe1 [Oleoguttula sp. CCFEE 5521]
MAFRAPEDIVVLLVSRSEGNLRLLSDNAAYSCEQPRHASNTGPPTAEKYDTFVLRFMGKQPYTHIGWVFGSSSDTEICDFQIAAGNSTSVSRQHFTICMTNTTSPGINLLSKNPIHLIIGAERLDGEDTFKLRKLVLRKTLDPWPIIGSVMISVGKPPIDILMWRPPLSAEQQIQYFDKATRMQRAVQDATPSPSHLGTRASDACMVRRGTNDKLYIMSGGSDRRGGSGTVELVVEKASKRVFAAKVLHFSSSASVSVAETKYDALLREYTRMQALDTPFVVQAVDLIASPSPSQPAWLVMEWLEHELKPKEFPRDDRAKLFEHISEGLGFMHHKRFVHDDVKPANIMVHMDLGRLVIAKLTDFGICSNAEVGSHGKIKGTAPYIAPDLWSEMSSQQGEVDLRSCAVDMWAFGITAVECLSSWSPSEDEHWKEAARFWPRPESFLPWLQEFKEQHVPFRTSAFGELLKGLLCDNPTQRWHATSVRKWFADHPGVHDERRITDTIDDDDREA